jgi:hypothetical protein
MSIQDLKEGEGIGILKSFDDIITKIVPDSDYTITQVAKLTGVSYSAILSHIRRENIKSRTMFGRIYVKGQDLKDYLCGKRN